MSIWSRVANLFRGRNLNSEIDEELRSHIHAAIEHGREPAEARKAFGSHLRLREESRDVRLIPWLDSLRADAVFGWRQLKKRKVTSAAAILSLALAIGACTSAFRLIDALLLRPLPVTNPERTYLLVREGTGLNGKPTQFDGWAYPDFTLMRAAVKGEAELIAVSYADRGDVTYGSDQDMERPYLQYVSGWMFDRFGITPAVGRLFTANDDQKPGATPYAVLSYDYWTRRFGQDRNLVGRTFHLDNEVYEIIGVAAETFTGTETGTVTDVFLPMAMHPFVTRSDATWFRTFAVLNAGAMEPVRQKLEATSRAFEEDRFKGVIGMSRQRIANFINQKVVMVSAAAGASGLQSDYRRSMIALAVLVGLVLLIACANVANLMSAQAAARAREMALRVSIGAGQWRLVQLVLVESAWIGLLAAATGGLFAWWSAPFVAGKINPPDNPARLILPADWRVVGFGVALTLGVIFLFGLIPALRTSKVKPANALRGGEDPHSRRRVMHALIAAQVAFCFLVLFMAGLFAKTFERLSHEPTGFSTDRLLLLDTVAQRAQPPALWDQMAEHLREQRGVECVALADSALMNNNARNNFIAVDGAVSTDALAYFRYVSPGWLAAMKVRLIDGRDFRPTDTTPGAAIVTESFAKQYFHGENPVGKFFVGGNPSQGVRNQVVGLVGDLVYRRMREALLPVALVPLTSTDAKGVVAPIRELTFIVRTSVSDPLRLAPTLRREVAAGGLGLRVSTVHTQLALNQSQTVRERLLAMLGLFFAAVALLLAGIGLYGVLDYSVLQQRREIGIRMAIGARPGHIVRRVTSEVFAMVLGGAVVGLALGMLSARYIQSLFYGVKATDLGVLVVPSLIIFGAALVAALPAAIRAVRIDPVKMLRTE